MLNRNPIQDCATCQGVGAREQRINAAKLSGNARFQYVAGEGSHAGVANQSRIRLNRGDFFPLLGGVLSPGSDDPIEVDCLDRVVVYNNNLPNPEADELLAHMRSGSARPDDPDGKLRNASLPFWSECTNLSLEPLVWFHLRRRVAIIGTNPDVPAGAQHALLSRRPGANRLIFLTNYDRCAGPTSRAFEEWQ
jgi:hypothetical protein